MHEDLMPFLKPGSDVNGIMSSAPVIKHAEVFGHSTIDQTASTEQVQKHFSNFPIRINLENCSSS